VTQVQHSYDAVIIGAGIIGCGIGFELSKRGVRTAVIEKNVGPGEGSTSASSAIIRFTYSTYSAVAMAYEGLRYWENWEDYLQNKNGVTTPSFHQCGMFAVKSKQVHYLKSLPHFDQIGIPYEHWGISDIKNRIPSFDSRIFGPPSRPSDDAFWDEPTEVMEGGLFTPEAGYISDPRLAAQNLFYAAEQKNCSFYFKSEVEQILTKSNKVQGVKLADGTNIDAPIIINAAGPYSGTINAMAHVLEDMSIKTRPLRQEVCVVPSSADLDFEKMGMAIADDDVGIYLRPETGNNILVGGTEPECDPLRWVPADHQGEIDPEQWEAQVLRLNRRIPSTGVPHQKLGVVGVYDVSDDWSPIYDATSLNGFYVAIGTSGNQFKNAPIAAHCMAELVLAVESGYDHEAKPLVVTGPHTNLKIDMGTFRRNRPINPNSPMSVHG
tara:strand:+ start:1565 stop:2875 length:1311 start_codon:yes stop_codon:yes gene_type:complete